MTDCKQKLEDKEGVNEGLPVKKEEQFLPVQDLITHEVARSQSKIRYTKNELEAARFQNGEEQQRMWTNIFGRLSPNVAKEYIELEESICKKQLSKPPWKKNASVNHGSEVAIKSVPVTWKKKTSKEVEADANKRSGLNESMKQPEILIKDNGDDHTLETCIDLDHKFEEFCHMHDKNGKSEKCPGRSVEIINNNYGESASTFRIVDQNHIRACENPVKRRYSRAELETIKSLENIESLTLSDEICEGLKSAAVLDLLATPEKLKLHMPNLHSSGQSLQNHASSSTRNLHPQCMDAAVKQFYSSDFLQDDYQEDSDGDYDSLQRPAFHVEGEPDFASGSPQDGFEYLRRVRWEAAQIPRVKVAVVQNAHSSDQTPYMPEIPEMVECPKHLLPCQTWVNAFMEDFSQLRQEIYQFDKSNMEHGIVFLGPTDGRKENAEKLLTVKDSPALPAILQLDYVSRSWLLKQMIELLGNASSLSRSDCLWLFSLCASVDSPIDAELSASLRCLLRKCATLRAAKLACDDEVMMLNMISVICGKYFGQGERRDYCRD